MSEILKLFNQYKSDAKTQETLAETYLPTSADSGNTENATDQKGPKGWKTMTFLALSVSLVILASAIFFVFITHALSINVTVNKKIPSPFENLLFTQKLGFVGGVDNVSHLADDYLILASTEKKLGAGITIDLDKPIDITDKILMITAMSKDGLASLKISFRDKNFRSFTSNIVKVGQRESEWQNLLIAPDKSKDSIDLKNITHLRISLNNVIYNEEETLAVYIKKVSLIDI